MAAPSAGFGLVLNGCEIRVTGIAPGTTLLGFVRSRGLTGAKEGCAEGECGACAVLVDGCAVNSCLIPLPSVADREVRTVEGLASGKTLTEVQDAMVRHGGSQCGYCTPGFVVSMAAEHARGLGQLDPQELGGNLCRCTGYRPIADALRGLGRVSAGSRVQRKVGRLSYGAAAGRFSRPVGLAECLALLREDAGASVVAGNTDLGVEMNLRYRRFSHLVSVEAVQELREFRDGPESVEIGAALTLSEVEERWVAAPAVVREWLRLFASRLIRNRATLGGSLGTASPIGDAAPLLLALDASVRIAGPGGERVVPLDEFFVGYRKTLLAAGEVVRSVMIPKPLPGSVRFFKVAKRRTDDISTVAAGIVVERGECGIVSKTRFAFGGVAAVPLRVRGAERAMEGTDGGPAALERVAGELRRALEPLSDHRGSAAYRMAMALSLVEKALTL